MDKLRDITEDSLADWDNFISLVTDIPSQHPHFFMPINWVGVSDLTFPLNLKNFPYPFTVKADIGCGLSKSKRGIHTSRIIEDVFHMARNPQEHIVSFIRQVSLKAKQRNPSDYSFAKISASGFYEKITNNKTSINPFKILASSEFDKKKEISSHGLSFQILTACPCTQSYSKYNSAKRIQESFGLEAGNHILKHINTSTHMQRTNVDLLIQDESACVDSMDLVELLNENFACSSELLKRKDEHILVEKSSSNPMFTEDVARKLCSSIAPLLTSLNSSAVISILVVAEESIHAHNVTTSISCSAGDILSLIK